MKTIEEAADALWKEIYEMPWYTAIGQGVHDGQPAIFLYVNGNEGLLRQAYVDGYQGYTVIVRRTGSIRPLGVS